MTGQKGRQHLKFSEAKAILEELERGFQVGDVDVVSTVAGRYARSVGTVGRLWRIAKDYKGRLMAGQVVNLATHSGQSNKAALAWAKTGVNGALPPTVANTAISWSTTLSEKGSVMRVLEERIVSAEAHLNRLIAGRDALRDIGGL